MNQCILAMSVPAAEYSWWKFIGNLRWEKKSEKAWCFRDPIDSAKFEHILKFKNCVYFQNSTFQVLIDKLP